MNNKYKRGVDVERVNLTPKIPNEKLKQSCKKSSLKRSFGSVVEQDLMKKLELLLESGGGVILKM